MVLCVCQLKCHALPPPPPTPTPQPGVSSGGFIVEVLVVGLF